MYYQSTQEHKNIKNFIKGYDDFFEVSYVYKYTDFLVEIKKKNGQRMPFFEKELEKVE